jgi:uncharacterized protein YegJ (DUF2314 family)
MKYFFAVAAIVVLFVVARVVSALRNVHACARTGRVERLRRLLTKDPALIRAVDSEGETPVHQAAKYGEMEALRFLVEQGGDVNARTNYGATPLHFAALFGEVRAATCLLEKGAHVDAKDELGLTPFHGAQSGEHRAMVELLVQAGANPDAVPALGYLGENHFVTRVADDDPSMIKATEKAREALPTLRQLFRELPSGTMVKFAFQSDSGQTEHLWGDLLALDEETFKVRVKTPPTSHRGMFEKVQQRGVSEIEDWQVEQRDGRIRGGFGFQVMFLQTKAELGQLPKELADQEKRFVDHDASAL